jgi:heptosyltransferase-2
MNILLVRPDGIGDEILCLPVASALRRLVPEAKITFLSSAYAAPVLAHHPDLDEVLTVAGCERFRDLVALFQRGWGTVLFLKPFRRLMLAAFAARVPCRVATGYRWYSVLANRRVYEHRHDFSKHESEYNLGLLRGLGLEPGLPVRPTLMLTEAEREWAKGRLAGMSAPRVVVHPAGFSPRPWRAAQYRALVQYLAEEGFGVVLTGNAAERERFWRESAGPRDSIPKALDLMGQVTLRELMAVIGTCHALVSGSTGPAHIAAALGVPTVSIFDPRRQSLPIRWRPLGENLVLRPEVPTCEKCVYEACPYWDCLDRITVTQVATSVCEAIERGHPAAASHV